MGKEYGSCRLLPAAMYGGDLALYAVVAPSPLLLVQAKKHF
jgi:hypothetical protein